MEEICNFIECASSLQEIMYAEGSYIQNVDNICKINNTTDITVDSQFTQIQDPKVKSEHCVITVIDDNYVEVKDSQANGVYFKIEAQCIYELQYSQMLTCGKTKFLFHKKGEYVYLCVYYEKEDTPIKMFKLTKGSIGSVGRRITNTISLTHDSLFSNEHFKFSICTNYIIVQDLSSTHGTFIQLPTKSTLMIPFTLKLGDHTFLKFRKGISKEGHPSKCFGNFNRNRKLSCK